MMHDDDDIDRALSALPLEEPPATLRRRILAVTVAAPPPAPVRTWEVWLIGVFAALAVWLTWLVFADRQIATAIGGAVARFVDDGLLSSAQTWLWVAIGASAALWLSNLSVPQRRTLRVKR